jgi:hypothetical protein
MIEEPTSPVALYDCVTAGFESVLPTEILINNMPVIDDQIYVIQATPCLSAGISNFSGKYNFIGIDGGSDVGAVDATSPFLAKYGQPISGKKISFNLKAVSTITGQSSVGVKISSIVV